MTARRLFNRGGGGDSEVGCLESCKTLPDEDLVMMATCTGCLVITIVTK